MGLVNYLVLGAIVFSLGTFGVLSRRNLIFIFMSLELMFGGVGITLVGFSRYLPVETITGQIFVVFILTVAAAETVLGLAIFLCVYRNYQTIAADEIKDLKG